MESQLKAMGCLDRIDQVMEEVPRVRKEMGYIPLVTPTSQIVGTQAVMNVLMGERYKTVPDESKNIFMGKYGLPPSPVDPEIQKKVLGDEQPITVRPADLIPNEWDKLKAEVAGKARNDDDVLSYAVFPKVWLDFYEKQIKDGGKAAKKAAEAKVAEAKAAETKAAEAKKAAAAPAHGASGTNGTSKHHYRLALNVNGQRYDAMVDVLDR